MLPASLQALHARRLGAAAAVSCSFMCTFMTKSIFPVGSKTWLVCSCHGKFKPPLHVHVHLCLHPTAPRTHNIAVVLYKHLHKRWSFAGCQGKPSAAGLRSVEPLSFHTSHSPSFPFSPLPPHDRLLSSHSWPRHRLQPFALTKYLHSFVCLFVWVSHPFPPLHWSRRRMSG